MKIEADAVIEQPRDVVFRAYRDGLPALVENLPRVKRVEVESRKERGLVVELVNVWYGAGKIPALAEKILPPVLSWHDYAKWDETGWTCNWHLESHAFPEAVICEGANRFVSLDRGRTRVEIAGEIRIDLSKVKLVPELVAAPVAAAVERFLVRQITPNLLTVSDAIEDYLEGEQRPTMPTL
ncbi:MAG: hypothetical protein AAGE52_14020 [Myxococcota bacterium]